MNKMWPEIKLGDLLDIQNGFAFNSKQFSEYGGDFKGRKRELMSPGAYTELFFRG